MRLDEDPCAAVPVREPRVLLAHRRRQRFDPIRKRLRAALARPFERMREDELAHLFPFAGIAKQRERLALQAACGYEMPGAGSGGTALLPGDAPAELLQQELPEES